MCEAGGDIGRLGAAKRRMLSLAERPSPVEVADCDGRLPLTGAAEGIVGGGLFWRGGVVSLGRNWCCEEDIGLAAGRVRAGKNASELLLGQARESGQGGMQLNNVQSGRERTTHLMDAMPC